MKRVVSFFACFLLSFAFLANSQAQFLSQISSSSTVVSNDVAVDNAGNTYVTGGFIGTANFGDTVPEFSLTSMGLLDIFVAKYDATGTPLWGFSIGGVAGGPGINDEGVSIAVSPEGNLFVTGYFQGTADFDPGSGVAEITSKGFRDAFLASYTSDGTFRWVEGFGGTADDRGQDVTAKSNTAVYFTGFFRETAAFPTGSDALTSAGEEDGYLISMNQNGSLTWLLGYGDTSVDRGNRVDTDDAGNVYHLGIFSRDVDFDPGADSAVLSSLNGSQDGVLSSYAADGSFNWAIPIGGPQLDGVAGLAVSGAGNVFITGFFIGTVDFDPQNSPQEVMSVGRDQYIATYTSTGSLSWMYPLGNGFAQGSDITLDDAGNVLVTGFFAGDVLPDPASALTLSSIGGQDMLLASYQPNGTFRWAHALGGVLSEIPTGLASSGGNVYLTGFFEDEVDFDPGANSLLAQSAGEYDGFLAQYGADGSFAVANEAPGSIQDNFSLEVFPNPAVNSTSLHLTSSIDGRITVEVVDVLGRQVQSIETHVTRDVKEHIALDVALLPAGLYFVHIKDDRTQSVLKTASVTVLR